VSSSRLVAEFYALIEIRIRLLLYHLDLFNLAWDDRVATQWAAVHGLLAEGARDMGLSPAPIPILGDAYESTGLFRYYDEDFRNTRDYFFVKMDISDPPIYWPLVFHELSHCWLSRSNHPDLIYSRHQGNLSGIDSEVASNRIEEALCDVISTRVVGPAFCISYLHKFWTLGLLREDAGHPTHAFRFECMSRSLDDLGLFEQAAELRDTVEARLEPWREEPIAATLEDIVSTGRNLFNRNHSTVYQRSRRGIEVTSVAATRDISGLFLSSWLALDVNDGIDSRSRFEKVNSTISGTLKGWAEPSQA
jgi:hypothetical protein